MISPMWRTVPLALFWFIYMGASGIFFPYYSLYLRENAELTGTQVGLVLSMLPFVGIIAEPFWGQVADRTGARSRILAFLSLGGSLGYLALGAARGFSAILLATVVLAAFTTAILSVTVSVTLAFLRGVGPYGFGLVRVWGTLGFLSLVMGFPWILQHFQKAHGMIRVVGGPSEPGLEVMFIVSAGLVFVAGLTALALPREGIAALRASRGEWRILFRNRAVVRFLLFALLAYFLAQGPMWLFPVYVRSRGGDLDTIRRMWVLMLAVEIPLVISSGAGLNRFGARGLLTLGVLAGGLRWTLCGFVNDLYVIYFIQMLHGVMVAGLVLGAPLYLDTVVPERLRSTGQALLSMVGVGIGGIASNAGAGWLLEHLGPDAPYIFSGIGSLILGSLVCWILPSTEGAATNKNCRPRGRWNG